MSLYFDNFGGSGKSAWTTNPKPNPQSPGVFYNQAQPVQPQSQGTPYGQQPAQQPKAAPKQVDFSAYKPQQPAAANPFTQYSPQQTGNFVQQQMGLPSFQFSATDSFGNTYNNPAALTAQQGAMAQAMNAQRAQQIQSGNFGPLNPTAAYQQAQNMVQGGWTNPFAAQPVPPPSQGTQYGMPQSQAGFGSSMLATPSQGTPYGQPAWRPKYGEYSPTIYYNDSGERFSGSASFVPGTSAADMSKAYGDWAEREGYFKRGSDGSKLPRQGTQYGTPPDQRGGPRTSQFIDRDGDGVDDRDQDGAGMPRYGAPPRGAIPQDGMATDYTGMPVLYAPSAPQQPAQPDPQRQRDQAAYEEVMQQLRIGGSAFDNMRADRRRAELEKKLGISPPPAVMPAAPAPPRQANPNTPTFGVYPSGTVSSPDSPVPAPPRPSPPSPAPQGRPSATPVFRAPQVWTNPSDPASFIKDLQSRGDTRPVVYDEKTRTYINNPYFAGAPGYGVPQRPSPAAPAQPAQQPYYDVLYGPSSNPYMPRNDALPYDMPWNGTDPGWLAALRQGRSALPVSLARPPGRL